MYLVLILFITSCIYLFLEKYKSNKNQHKLPPVYPGALPIIGHSHLLLYWARDVYGFIESMSDFCRKSGGVTCGYFAGDIYYGVVDPEDAATVSCQLLRKHPMLVKFAGSWVGEGLITSSGPLYKRHRRLLSPAFSLPTVYGFLSVFNEQSRRLAQLLENKVGHGPFDSVAMFRNLTLRTTCITVFGDKTDKDKEFIDKYITGIDEIFRILMQRLSRPWLHNDYIYSFSNLKKKQDEVVGEMDRISYEVIQRKKDEMKTKTSLENIPGSEETMKAFIDVMLEIAADGTLSDQEVRDELNTTLVASFETSSVQVIIIAVLLGSYPEIQEKVYQEIMEVVGDRDVEKDDLPKLVYTEAVIKECLRVIPAVPLLPRVVDKDLKLKNYTLRAGTYVFFLPGGIHHNEAWGPDVDEFKPERWLDEENAANLANLNFAFSHGPRSCIGRKYAMVAIKVTLVHILRKFKVTADVTKLKLAVDIITRLSTGHELTVEWRNEKYDINQNELVLEEKKIC